MTQKAFERGRIGTLELKNRFVMPAMGTGFASANGEASEEIIRYYEERARGGCALIITEIMRIDDESGVGMANQLAATELFHIQRLGYLADAVHQYDCKIFAQLHHPGRQTPSKLLNGHPIVAPSPIPSGVVKEMPKELSQEEIRILVEKFIKAAAIVKTAGFDGIELHAAHGYLISQFLSPFSNKREDDYGGDLTGRMRFLNEIIAGIHLVCGPLFPICVRINGNDFLPGGLEPAECAEIAKCLEKAGVDALNVSSGMYESGWSIIEPSSLPEAWKKDLAANIKAHVSIPVIAVNNIKHPEMAEKLLQAGVCDFVGIGRCHLTDPEFVNKTRQNQGERIRKCIGCLYCFKQASLGRPIACTVNPRLGRESRYNELTIARNGNGRKIAVVGGGPAGMQAAIILSHRGFDVSLYEKSDRLGGMMNLGDKPPFKSLMTEFCATLQGEVQDAGVDIKLNREVTADELSKLDLYGVVLACGGKPFIPPVEGIKLASANESIRKDHTNGTLCYTFDQVLRGDVNLTGKSIVVMGGGETGLETAEFLAGQGNTVQVAEMLPAVGTEMYASVLAMMMKRFAEKSIQIHVNHQLLRVQEHDLIFLDRENEDEISIPADILILAGGVRTDPTLLDDFRAHFDKLIVTGDAARPGNIADALKRSHDQAMVF